MNRLNFFRVSTLLFLLLTLPFASMAKELKVLTIGNSFAHSIGAHLPKVAASVPGCYLKLGFANLPGCSLRQHWNNAEREERNESAKFYGKAMGQPAVYKLREILTSEKWDIISIQQASHDSWRPETFQPYADKLIGYIRNYAPQAEIVIQQTWSYRRDCPLFKEWNITPKQMYSALNANYRKLAEGKGLRVIPMGLAVELGRSEQPEICVPYDRAKLSELVPPDLPSRANLLVGNCFWRKGKNGDLWLRQDYIHLSPRGEYLQACLWFAFLFDKKTSEIAYVPSFIGDSDARWLRDKAQQALDSYRQAEQ